MDENVPEEAQRMYTETWCLCEVYHLERSYFEDNRSVLILRPDIETK